MNREIKFRIWDKQNKTFVKDPTRYQRLAISCDGRGVYSGKYDDCDVEDRYFIQQYTGLKDKNGKEIYEGDIVKFQYGATTRPSGVFAWCENRAGWVIKPFSTLSIEVMYNVEVVGNIFETPELLK